MQLPEHQLHRQRDMASLCTPQSRPGDLGGRLVKKPTHNIDNVTDRGTMEWRTMTWHGTMVACANTELSFQHDHLDAAAPNTWPESVR